MKRKTGYYWIKIKANEEDIIGFYRENEAYWYFPGESNEFEESTEWIIDSEQVKR